MKLHFDLTGIAPHSERPVRIREAVRILSLAWCLDRIGANVSADVPPELADHERLVIFRHLFGNNGAPRIVTVTRTLNPRGSYAIAYKTTEATEDKSLDGNIFRLYDLVVAHETDVDFQNHPGFIPVPIGINGRVLEAFHQDEMMEAWLANDFTLIRKCYSTKRKPVVGFCGSDLHGRPEYINRLSRIVRPLKVRWWTSPGKGYRNPDGLSAREYLRWMSCCEGGLHLPGNTPKSSRFSEIALMGLCLVTVPECLQQREEPEISDRNAIIVDHDMSRSEFVARWERRQERQHQLEADYVSSWSPMGQARRILHRLETAL